MRTRIKLIVLCLAVLYVFNSGNVIAATGLRARGTDVALEGLGIGRTYNLRVDGKYPYVIINASDHPVKVKTEVEIPLKHYLKDEYEEIPDPGWIRIFPSEFTLGVGESKTCDIILSIPNNEQYNGRHFQVMLRAYTGGRGMMRAGVRNRLRFSIGTLGPESLQKEKIRKKMVSMNFDIRPDNLFVNEIEPGKRLDVGKKKKLVFKVANRGEEKLNLKFSCETGNLDQFSAMGYEPGKDAKWLKVKPEKLTVKPDTIKSFSVIVDVPDEEEHYNKKYGFLIKTELIGADVPIELKNKVYIKTKEKQEK